MHALFSFSPMLEEAGFKLTEACFDGGVAPENTINYERERSGGQVDFVMTIFDKLHRPKFQVVFGCKEFEPPHKWLLAGSLVWKQESELQKFKWWGPRWWHAHKHKILALEIERVATLLPEVSNFLAGEAAGANIWQDEIKAESHA